MNEKEKLIGAGVQVQYLARAADSANEEVATTVLEQVLSPFRLYQPVRHLLNTLYF